MALILQAALVLVLPAGIAPQPALAFSAPAFAGNYSPTWDVYQSGSYYWSDGGSDTFDGAGYPRIEIGTSAAWVPINQGYNDPESNWQVTLSGTTVRVRHQRLGNAYVWLVEHVSGPVQPVRFSMSGNLGSDGSTYTTIRTVDIQGTSIRYGQSDDGYLDSYSSGDPEVWYAFVPRNPVDAAKPSYSWSRDNFNHNSGWVTPPVMAVIAWGRVHHSNFGNWLRDAVVALSVLGEPPFAPAISLPNDTSAPSWQQRVTWSAAGNPPETTYELWRKTYSGNTPVQDQRLYAGAGTEFVTGDQASGRYYLYRVRAVYNGKEKWSNEVPYHTAPEHTVSVTGARQLRIDWMPPFTGLSYQVNFRRSGGSWSAHGTTQAGAATYTAGSLDPNSTYEFTLSAVLPNGGTAWSAGPVGTYSPTWEAPGAISFSSVNQTGATVGWSNGSLPSTGVTYRLFRDGQQIYQGTGRSHTDSGLSPGTQYTYSVCAVNVQGLCGASSTATLTTVPPRPATPTGTVGGLGWAPVGRGYAVVNWQPVQGASGYAVWVFDGNQYRRFDVGNATSWDSRTARIYPTESWINGQCNNCVTADPFKHDQSGEHLRDNPNSLYRKTAGTTYDDATNYWFRVSAYNGSGESPYSEPWKPTLPEQTDPNAPTGVTVRVNDGAEQTGGTRVRVTVTAQDDNSGLSSVQLSNDGSDWTDVTTMSGRSDSKTVEWKLDGTSYGTKTVFARVKDVAGNWSAPASARILYMLTDVTGPRVQLRINGGATSTDNRNVTLEIHATDDQAPQSLLKMRFSNDGTDWSAWESYQPARSWTLTEGEGRKSVWVQVQDAAGNPGGAIAEIFHRASLMPVTNTPAFFAATGSQGQFDTGSGAVAVQFVRVRELEVRWADVTGAGTVRYGFDQAGYGGWETFAPARTIALPPQQGIQTLYAQLDDGRVFAVRFLMDTVPPTVSAAWQGGASVTGPGGAAVLVLHAQDNVTRAEDLQVSVNAGPWTSYQPQIPLTLPGSGTQTVTVTVRDPAGNTASALLDMYVLP